MNAITLFGVHFAWWEIPVGLLLAIGGIYVSMKGDACGPHDDW